MIRRRHRRTTTGAEIAGMMFLSIVVFMVAIAILGGLGMVLIYMLKEVAQLTGAAA